MKTGESSLLWMLKNLAGVLIIVILLVHFVVNHALVPGGLLSYSDVVAYYQKPFIVGMEIFFLIFLLVHVILGLRSIVLDLNPSPLLLRWLDIAFALFGGTAMVYGIWLAITIANRG